MGIGKFPGRAAPAAIAHELKTVDCYLNDIWIRFARFR
jgi:hypothetical protein